jgi:hypothetical protein
LEGTHFRRQVPIGPYIADLACLAARLVIELDGAPHSRDDVAERDRLRQAWLEREGYRVLRFWNDDVFTDIDGVLDTIYAALHGGPDTPSSAFAHRRRRRTGYGHPTPALRADPPPAGEGEEYWPPISCTASC